MEVSSGTAKESVDENKKNYDFPVDNLIKELNNFIESCNEKKENVSTQSKTVSNGEIKEIFSCEADILKSSRNKRKSITPIKIPKKKSDKNGDHWESFCNSESASVAKETNEDASELTGLTIDDTKLQKRKKVMRMGDVPSEVMDLIVKSGIDDRLEDVAMRERLTGAHVKNIIKQVITDTSVLAMLKSGIDGTDDSFLLANFEPKLTRARKRELDGMWNEGSINHSGPAENFPSVAKLHSSYFETWPDFSSSNVETLTLGSTEFPDEEDDEEYRPELDAEAVSDEESLNSSVGSPSIRSIHSLSSFCSSSSKTPMTRDFVSPSSVATLRKEEISPRRHLVRKSLHFGREDSLICNRTRSKYPLNNTPLEHLELAFQPPDITADMYETNLNDEEYTKFLLEFSQPQDDTRATEDDEQMDPEYNLIGDAEEEDPSPDELKEEMRGDRAVKISRREVNELLNDFINSDEEEFNEDGSSSSVNCTQLESAGDAVQGLRLLIEYSDDQLEVLECQLAQHVQLLTQSVLMTTYEETLSKIENGCKSMLRDMQFVNLQSCRHSGMFKMANMEAALTTVQHYDSRRRDFLHYRLIKSEKDAESHGLRVPTKIYPRSFPPIIQRILALSSAFLFLDLLPKGAFPLGDSRSRKGFTTSEYYLLACDFKEVVSDVKIFNLDSRKKNAKYFDSTLAEICDSVAQNTIVITTGKFLTDHFSRLLKQNLLEGRHDDNPLIKFTKTGVAEVPKSIPSLEVLRRGLFPLKDVDPWALPPHFQNLVKRFRTAEKVSSLSCASEKAKGTRILIVQNQCETKIILPSSSAELVVE